MLLLTSLIFISSHSECALIRHSHGELGRVKCTVKRPSLLWLRSVTAHWVQMNWGHMRCEGEVRWTLVCMVQVRPTSGWRTWNAATSSALSSWRTRRICVSWRTPLRSAVRCCWRMSARTSTQCLNQSCRSWLSNNRFDKHSVNPHNLFKFTTVYCWMQLPALLHQPHPTLYF